MGDYYGIPTGFLTNEHLHLEYLLAGDPHIVRLSPAGSNVNLFAETPNAGWDTPHGRYCLFGGHRLWHAPESGERNGIPNPAPLQADPVQNGIRLYQPGDVHTRLGKVIEIRLAPATAGVVITHILINEGVWAYELAPWAVTELPLGGLARICFETSWPDVRRDIPDRKMVLWPFTSLPDPRFSFQGESALFDAGRSAPHGVKEFKLGFYSTEIWMEYQWNGFSFKKSAALQPGQYPDGGCSMELYCGDHYLELETLGPTVRLEPGQQVEHVEVWEIS